MTMSESDTSKMLISSLRISVNSRSNGPWNTSRSRSSSSRSQSCAIKRPSLDANRPACLIEHFSGHDLRPCTAVLQDSLHASGLGEQRLALLPDGVKPRHNAVGQPAFTFRAAYGGGAAAGVDLILLGLGRLEKLVIGEHVALLRVAGVLERLARRG